MYNPIRQLPFVEQSLALQVYACSLFQIWNLLDSSSCHQAGIACTVCYEISLFLILYCGGIHDHLCWFTDPGEQAGTGK